MSDAKMRMDAEKRAATAVSQARMRLIFGGKTSSSFVYFATIAMKLKAVACWDIDTMATDGKRILYNPDFTCGMSDAEVLGVVVHEVLHVAMAHHARMGNRPIGLWNIACDLAINPIVKESRLSLPDGVLMPGFGPFKKYPTGLSAEEYYSLLRDEQSPEIAAMASGADPGGCGGLLTPGDGSEAAAKEAEAEARIMNAQAASAAKSRGNLPGGLARASDEAATPKVDWREKLRNFLTKPARNDYSWATPNRRHIHNGLYLPGLSGFALGKVVATVDQSGSITQEDLNRFAGELEGILSAYEAELLILHHDVPVTHEEEWRSHDGPLTLKAHGGGGTSHIPVFERIAKIDEPIECIVCLTDMYSSFPKEAPDVPVLWCSTGGKKAPFGELVEIN